MTRLFADDLRQDSSGDRNNLCLDRSQGFSYKAREQATSRLRACAHTNTVLERKLPPPWFSKRFS